MKTIIPNNSVIAFALQRAKKMKMKNMKKMKKMKKKMKMGDFKVRSFADDTRSLAFKANL